MKLAFVKKKMYSAFNKKCAPPVREIFTFNSRYFVSNVLQKTPSPAAIKVKILCHEIETNLGDTVEIANSL